MLVSKSIIQAKRNFNNKRFYPILPYPTTQFDTIYTCMKKFQDILKQRELPYGPLWSDQGVYRIGKEI